MSAAYSDFFASGLKNSSTRSKSRFSTMSLDIPMGNNGFTPDACSRTSSPAIDSPLLHFESPLAADAMDSSDMTPTTAGTPKANSQGRLLRKRRSSLSMAVGIQGNASAIKSPSRAVQVSRARSGSTASFTTTATESSDQVRVGRGRSGSIGSALKSTKRRSMKMGLAPPPLPPPRSPLPDLPSFLSVLNGDVPGTAPPDMTSFNIQPLRSPLAVRSFQHSSLQMPHSDSALKSSPIRDAFDFSGYDQQMKEN